MRSFTLVELLAVVAILALVVGGGLAVFSSAHQGALRQQAHAQLAALAAQLDDKTLKNNGVPPLSLAGSSVVDPWGRAILYAPQTGSFTLKSLGGDPDSAQDDILYDSAHN